jgi:nicotinamidase-related amidase
MASAATMSKTALLVIDVQSALVASADQGSDVVAVIHRLIERARGAGTPVIYLQHYDAAYQPLMKGAAGWHIHADVAPQPGETVIEKTASDGFFQTNLQAELERPAVERLIVCGLQTEFCVDTTCRVAFSRGFEVVLAADAHTTTDAIVSARIVVQHHNYALANLAHPQRRITVMPSAEIAVG